MKTLPDGRRRQVWKDGVKLFKNGDHLFLFSALVPNSMASSRMGPAKYTNWEYAEMLPKLIGVEGELDQVQ